MIPPKGIKVYSQWLDKGMFFIWAEQPDLYYNPLPNATELKFRLFARHRPTYYGTFVEVMEHDRQVGLKVPPRLALDFFTEPSHVKFLDWQWSEEFLKLREIARCIKVALLQGQWRPDFEKWQAGKTGWKLDWPSDLDLVGLPLYTEEWIDRIINDMIVQDQDTSYAWIELQIAYPLLDNYNVAGTFTDEESWLEAIGWRQDQTPFRACLQLLEPEEEDTPWELKVLLQDKNDKNRLAVWDPCVLAPQKTSIPVESMTEFRLPGGDILVPDAAIPPEWIYYKEKIDRDIKRWLDLVPWLKDDHLTATHSEDETNLLRRELSEGEAWELLDSGSLELVNAGFTVFLPKWWEDVQKLKPLLKVKTRSSVGTWGEGWLGADRLVQFDWKLSVGDIELSEEEFRELADKKHRLAQIRGKWVQLDPLLLQKVQKLIKQKKNLSLAELLQMHFLSPSQEETEAEILSGEEALRIEVELNQQLSGMVEQLTHYTKMHMEETSLAFRGQLRKYQLFGSTWLLFLRRFGLGGCLADDMGLGKTIQWIAYLLKVKESEKPASPSLLICPTSVLGNWQKELARFAPDIQFHLHYGPQRKKGEDFLPALSGKDLVLTSYNLAHLDEEDLRSLEWDCICLDEAQNIKNVYTKQASAVRRLTGRHRVALTGTPMENRLTELWSIMDFLNPRYLGSISEFNRRFASVIERRRDKRDIERVQSLIRPFLLRRVKSDPAIELDLPEKQELKEYIPLTVEQASLYENTLQQMFERLEETKGMARRGIILSTLIKLKLLCNHPALFLKENSPTNIKERSLKLERLLDMVEKLRQEGDRCLIFTQFVGMGKIIEYVLQRELQERAFFLHGGTPRARRDEMIESFQNPGSSPDDANIFILSLKAGGLGLNLTAANHVFHFDRWWNPAVENQATDRSHRIGQKRHVQVHKFICLGTLEERIDEMIESKQGLNDQIVGGGEAWITELSTGELREIFALRREWVSS